MATCKEMVQTLCRRSPRGATLREQAHSALGQLAAGSVGAGQVAQLAVWNIVALDASPTFVGGCPITNTDSAAGVAGNVSTPLKATVVPPFGLGYCLPPVGRAEFANGFAKVSDLARGCQAIGAASKTCSGAGCISALASSAIPVSHRSTPTCSMEITERLSGTPAGQSGCTRCMRVMSG